MASIVNLPAVFQAMICLVIGLHYGLGTFEHASLSKSREVSIPINQAHDLTISAEKGKTYCFPIQYAPPLIPGPTVAASINGEPPLYFLIDTGSAGFDIYLEKWVVEKMRLSTGERSGYIYGDTSHGIPVRSVFFSTFEFTPKNENQLVIRPGVSITSDKDILTDASRGPYRLAGMIGLGAFEKMVTRFVFSKGELHLRLPEKEDYAAPECVSLNISRNKNGTASITTHLNSKTVRLLIDTGAWISSIPSEILKDYERREDVYIKTVVGMESRKSYMISQAKLSDVSIRDWLCYAPEYDSFAKIGMDFLSMFDVTVDLPGNRLVLVPFPNQTSLSPSTPGGCLALLSKSHHGDKIVVAFAPPGSPFETGDEIQKINGRSVEKMTEREAQALLNGSAGAEAVIEGKREGKGGFEIEYKRPSLLQAVRILFGENSK